MCGAGDCGSCVFASAASGSSALTGGENFVHDWPRSAVRSKWMFHPRRTASAGLSPASVLEGHSSAPSVSWIGLFLTGPRKPGGSRLAADHVRPASSDVLSRPHHADGLGPTL